MPDIWGLLAKSLTDNETIEEAIARIVAQHNDDPESHLGSGQSLLSHKASEIIDHLASSIVEDKIQNKAIGIDKLLWDKLIVESNFQSIDGFGSNIVGAGSYITPQVGECIFQTDDSVNDECSLYIEWGYNAVMVELNPFFQIFAKIFTDTLDYGDVAFICGDNNPFRSAGGNTHIFGFKWLKADQKMYAFYHSSTTEYKQEITGYSFDNNLLYRAELVHDTDLPAGEQDTIKFYINNNLEYTFENVDCGIDSNYPVSVGVKNQTVGGICPISLLRLIFCENVY